jgi:hypothetical protein
MVADDQDRRELLADGWRGNQRSDHRPRLVASPSIVPSVGSNTVVKEPRFRLIPFHELKPSDEPEYLIKGLFPRVGLILVWGRPKCGKSFWMTNTALHVALEWEYRGRKVHGGPVVYCAFEGQSGYGKRAEAFRTTWLPEDHDEVRFYLVAAQMSFVRDHSELIGSIRLALGTEIKPAMVVLDTLNRSLEGSESDDRDMAAYIKAADAVRAALGCAVVIVHHCGIDGTRPRGHTSLGGAVDAQIAVTRDAADNIIATVEWMKDGEEGETIVSRLKVVEVGTDNEGEPITSCVVVPVEGAPAELQPPKSAKPHEPPSFRTFRAAFTEALDTAGQTISVRGDGPSVRAVEISLVRDQFNQRHATGETDPKKRADAQRKAFKRCLDKLVAQYPTCVQCEKEWIWSIAKDKA